MLDELVGPDDLVRVIDAWISSLDLKALGFRVMRLRRSTVEHPFGTIKTQILGNARLLMRGLEGA